MKFCNIINRVFCFLMVYCSKRFEEVTEFVLLICLGNVENNNILLWR